MELGIAFHFLPLLDGGQIVVWDHMDERLWDAVCYTSSYGHKKGLLEIKGTLCRARHDSAEGDLTAKEILKRVEEEKIIEADREGGNEN